jgi:hypothetical protein
MGITDEYKAHLQIDPSSGGPIQRTGCGLNSRITISRIADGWLPLTLKTLTAHCDSVYIANVPVINLWVYPNFDGAITKIKLIPSVSMEEKFDVSIGSGGLNPIISMGKFSATTFGELIPRPVMPVLDQDKTGVAFSLPNPGGKWLRIYTTATGATSASSGLDLYYVAGWGDPWSFIT